MVLVFHIVVALVSLIYGAYLFLAPTRAKLYVNYGFISLTLLSGTYLVVSKPAHMLETCVTGLVYVGVVTMMSIAAHARLVRVNAKV